MPDEPGTRSNDDQDSDRDQFLHSKDSHHGGDFRRATGRRVRERRERGEPSAIRRIRALAECLAELIECDLQAPADGAGWDAEPFGELDARDPLEEVQEHRRAVRLAEREDLLGHDAL